MAEEYQKKLDSELDGLFETGGRETMKAMDNKAKSKNKFLSELIKFKLKDPATGLVGPNCNWHVQRRKCTLKVLQDLVNRCPIKCEIDYLYDSSGSAMWVEDMMLHCQPEPEHYFIVPKVTRKPFDILTDSHYEGQVAFNISRVPAKSKDEKTEVDASALKEWLVFALLEVDPYSKPFISNMAKVKEEIEAIDKKIKQIPKMEFRTAQGELMTEEEAAAERTAQYEAFGQQRMDAEQRIVKQKEALEAHRQWRRGMGIQLQRGDLDLNSETYNWTVRFYGTKDAQEMEDLLILKEDWAAVKLALGSKSTTPPCPPWAGRGDIPNGSKAFEADYTDRQVNISGARIMRIPHGVGTFRQMDRKSSKTPGDFFALYYGEWFYGKRQGQGMDINDAGVYSGRFVEDYRNGSGRLDLANGTVIEGQFGCIEQVKGKLSGDFCNPYFDGEPQGKVSVLFADGSIYRGNAVDGTINGEGEYESAFGELLKGNFVDGVLQGENGYCKNYAGEQFFGCWEHGDLHGKGTWASPRGDSYVGFWQHGLRHGRGIEQFRNRGSFRGYFINGMRTGKGELDYVKRKKPKIKKKNVSIDNSAGLGSIEESKDKVNDKSKDKDKEAVNTSVYSMKSQKMPEFKYRYQGYFIADAITSGGISMETVYQTPYTMAKRDKRSMYPINSLFDKINKSKKELRRKCEKLNDMENFVRREMVKKKIRIYNQQKHYTKKLMYDDEQRAINPSLLAARTNVRVTRFERLDMEALASKKAFLERLKKVDSKPASHLQQTFKRIVVEKEKGERTKFRNVVPRLAVSDFEEACERHRLLKYDMIMERAEAAFAEKRKAAAGVV